MARLQCAFTGCASTFRSQQGRTYHFWTFHLNNNLVEEVDIQANVPHQPPAMAADDADYEMGDEEPAPGPLPNHVPRAVPSAKRHPYLTGNVFSELYRRVPHNKSDLWFSY